MATEIQQAKRLAFWQIFGAGLLITSGLFFVGLAQAAALNHFFG